MPKIAHLSTREENLDRCRWDALADSVLVADADARYLDANLAALKLLGYTLAELRAMTVNDIVAHGAAWTTAEYERFVTSGCWEGRLVIRPKSQTLVIVEARATVLRLPSRTEYISVLREKSIPGVTVGLASVSDDRSSPNHSLTSREREVIALVAAGATSAEIANQLGISPRTADTHRHRIMRKVNVNSIAELARFAVRHGLSR